MTYRSREGEVRTYLRTLEVEGSNPRGTVGRILQEITWRQTTLEVIPRERTTTKYLIERVRIEIARPGKDGVLRLDTAEAAQKEPAPGPGQRPGDEDSFLRHAAPFRRMVGASAEIVQFPSGKVDRIDGIDAFRKHMTEGLAADAPLRKVVEQLPWAFWIASMVSPAIGVPDRGMSVGQEIQFQDMRILPETVQVPGFLYYRGSARFAEAKDGIARFEMQGEVSLDPPSGMPPWPPAFAPGRPRLRLQRGSCKASARIAVETGCLEEDEHVTDLDLQFVKPDGTGGIPVPTKITMRTKLVR